MVYMTVITGIAVFFFTRYYFLKREMKRVTKQLQVQTEKKVDLSFFDQDLEQLAVEINQQIDLTKQAGAEKRRTENELKQAIANISHDIRTPMTSILGYIQFLEASELSDTERAKYTQIVKDSAMRLKILLEDFFELSIIESTDYPLKIETIKMNRLVLDVLVGFYEQFKQRHLEPSVHIPDNPINIKADPSAVKRVIENLISNAIKHSTGGVTIRLKEATESVVLSISNPAEQLSEKELILLFDRFYKADQTRTGNGTGLGLPIAKSLMTKMGGQLTAELKDQQLIMKCEWKL